jgi:hypothetical protein
MQGTDQGPCREGSREHALQKWRGHFFRGSLALFPARLPVALRIDDLDVCNLAVRSPP